MATHSRLHPFGAKRRSSSYCSTKAPMLTRREGNMATQWATDRTFVSSNSVGHPPRGSPCPGSPCPASHLGHRRFCVRALEHGVTRRLARGTDLSRRKASRANGEGGEGEEEGGEGEEKGKEEGREEGERPPGVTLSEAGRPPAAALWGHPVRRRVRFFTRRLPLGGGRPARRAPGAADSLWATLPP